MVWRDGTVGTAVFPGIAAMSCDAIGQVPGSAQRLSAAVLRREMLLEEQGPVSLVLRPSDSPWNERQVGEIASSRRKRRHEEFPKCENFSARSAGTR
jgi:hypothetical protein